MGQAADFHGNASVKIGRIRVTMLLDSWLALDGGAMFGIVPKVLWEQKLAPDALNRVRMPMRPLLVQTPTNTVVIESGIGQALPPEVHERYGIERPGPLLGELVRAAGVDPARVDTMACTHLHWDHSGGVCKLEGGRYSPTFAGARHVFQRGEWKTAVGDDNFHKASYVAPSLLPVEEAGLLKLVEGDAEIAPGIRFEFTNGHTEHHAVIWIEDSGESACFFGDLVPMSAQVPLAWISAYDSNAVGSFRAREALYDRIMQRSAQCLFYHEPAYPVGRLIMDRGRYSAQLIA